VDRSAYPLRTLHPCGLYAHTVFVHITTRCHVLGWMALFGSRPSCHFVSATPVPIIYIPFCPLLHYLSSFRFTVAAAYHALPHQPVALFIPHVATRPSIHISGRIFPSPFSLFYIGRSSLTPPTLVIKVVICLFDSHLTMV